MSKLTVFFACEFAIFASLSAALIIHAHTVASAAGI